MNSYISVVQLFQFFDERTAKGLSGDKNAPEGSAPNILAMADAEAARVETYLTGRVAALPPTNATTLNFLRMLIADLVQARLYMRRTDAPEAVVKAGRDARDWLEDFMKGLVSLPGETQAKPALHRSRHLDGRSDFDTVLGISPTRDERQSHG